MQHPDAAEVGELLSHPGFDAGNAAWLIRSGVLGEKEDIKTRPDPSSGLQHSQHALAAAKPGAGLIPGNHAGDEESPCCVAGTGSLARTGQ